MQTVPLFIVLSSGPDFSACFSLSPEYNLLGPLIVESPRSTYPLLHGYSLSTIQALKFPLIQFLPELKMQMCLLYCPDVLSFHKRLCAGQNALSGAVQEGGSGGAEWPLNCHGLAAECFIVFRPVIGMRRTEEVDGDSGREK